MGELAPGRPLEPVPNADRFIFAARDNQRVGPIIGDGNGNNAGLSGGADRILSPGTAKNVITVGTIEQPRFITNVVTVIRNGVTNRSTPWIGQTDSAIQVAVFSGRGNVGVELEGDAGRFKPDVVAPGTFVVSTRSTMWDQAAYYNPTNYHVENFFDQVVNTNEISIYVVFVPENAVRLDISVATTNGLQLPIYVNVNDLPTTANFVGNGSVSFPANGPLTTSATYFYAIGNPTNHPVGFDLTTTVVTTNDNGDFFQVLSNLNVNIGSSPYYYRYETGTSMSAADVSGVLALMQDFFTNKLSATPSPALPESPVTIRNAASRVCLLRPPARNRVCITPGRKSTWGVLSLREDRCGVIRSRMRRNPGNRNKGIQFRISRRDQLRRPGRKNRQ